MAEQDESTDGQTNTPPTDEELKQHRNRLLTQLDKAEKANRETMEQLQRRGMQPNGLQLTRLRVEILISMMLGNKDSLQRLQFELVWQKELQDLLATMYQNSNEKKLHIPGAN